MIEAIVLQEEIGLPILTDGEYRRRFFFSTIEVLVDGIDPEGYVRHHRDEHGREQELRTPTPVARLTRKGTLADYELGFPREHTGKSIKVAMPKPHDEFAASIFPHTLADRLLLEYDDERSGGGPCATPARTRPSFSNC